MDSQSSTPKFGHPEPPEPEYVQALRLQLDTALEDLSHADDVLRPICALADMWRRTTRDERAAEDQRQIHEAIRLLGGMQHNYYDQQDVRHDIARVLSALGVDHPDRHVDGPTR